MDIVSIIAFSGIAMIVVGLLGGIEAEKIKIPKLPNWARILIIITGVALLILSIYIFPQSPFNPNNVTNMQATQSVFESTAVAFANLQTQAATVQTMGGTPLSPNLILAESTFDGDSDGWSMLDFGSDGITYNSSGGVSGGYIQLDDTDGDSYWVAPEKFIRDKSTAYGGILIFNLKTNLISGNIFDVSDVILIGANGVELTFNTHSVPGIAWTTYSILLNESAGWINQNTGQNASRDEMLEVLSSLSELRIRGEFYRGSNDYGSLDNVIMLRQP